MVITRRTMSDIPDSGDVDSRFKAGAETSTTTQCPICAYIEAGPCKEPHQVWTKCRDEAKEQGTDYIDMCQDTFKAFLQCAFNNSDYYEPFLAMLMGGPEGEEEANSNDAQAKEEMSPASNAASAS